MPNRWSVSVASSVFHRRHATRPLAVAVLFAAFVAGTSLLAQTTPITPAEAKDYVGQIKTVCGKVASVNYALQTRGAPTFINLDKPYPNHVFTVVIWGSDRPKFGTPEADYRDKAICVTGQITLYRGVPEIVAKEAKQISLAKS